MKLNNNKVRFELDEKIVRVKNYFLTMNQKYSLFSIVNKWFIGFILIFSGYFFSVNHVRAEVTDCSELTEPAKFYIENNLLCLQKITIAEQPGTEFYKASLVWGGPDNPNQFKLLSTEQDTASELLNNPTISTVSGSLVLPKIDVPGAFGTERYVANLKLKDNNDNSIFELSPVSVFINPDYVPNITWKPYGMHDPEERQAVDLLGRSIPYAKLADAVYDFDNTVIDEWVLFETKDKNSGMQAAVYYNPESDEVVLAFRGTETCNFPCSFSETAEFLLDTAADALLTVGQADTQFKDAVSYAEDVVLRAQGRKIIVTGHSLGGGLAQAVGSVFGLETFAFNSAPVPEEFFEKYNPAVPFEELSGIIHVISDIHDPVSNTDETGKFYLNADHVSSLIQFDFDDLEILPVELKKLKDLRFDRHSMTDLVDNALSLITIYQDGW